MRVGNLGFTCGGSRHHGRVVLALFGLLTVVTASGQDGMLPGGDDGPLGGRPRPLIYIIPGKPQISTLYHDGSQIVIQEEQRWRFMCGSDVAGRTIDDLRRAAESHNAAFEDGPDVVIDSGVRTGGINIIYNLDGSVPSAAYDAFTMAELLLESLFSDDIEVQINAKFEDLGSGVLGATFSWYRDNESYRNSRDGLQSGMDGDDVIQAWLPSGNTIPVRYDGNSDVVTDENRIDWTRANYRATIGSVSGVAAGMSFNSRMCWDYDPSNGVGGSRYSFVDVLLHETGHALGFTSGVDSGAQMHALDIYRFQRTDGAHDYNPDTYPEFQTTPRLVDYNVPNDAHNSDLIDYEYRMSDGNPYQASHFRQQTNPWIGLMDPAIAAGETHYPNFFSDADINMFDAIGYDYPPCPIVFTAQPEPEQLVCPGDVVSLSVTVENPVVMTYQWRRGTTDLVDDGVHIFGATTDTLLIVDVTEADEASDYNCLVTNTLEDCSLSSATAAITVDAAPTITAQPQDLTVAEGEMAQFSVAVAEPYVLYQWRKDGSPLSDGPRIFGSTSETLVIYPVEAGDAGQYDCVVTLPSGAQCSTTSDAATLTVESADDCPEDLNGDRVIDLQDLAALLAAYLSTPDDPNWNPEADFNGDGVIDLSDLSQLLSVYLEECPTR